MKKIIITATFLLGCLYANAQVGIGTTTPDNSSVLELQSANKGLLVPRVALTGINDATTIPSPAKGLVVFNTTTNKLQFNAGTSAAPVWTDAASGTSADGSETKVNAGTGVSVTGTGTTASPYVVNSTITQADGTETKVNAGTGVSVTGVGTTASPYVVNSTITQADGAETKVNVGTGLSKTGTGTTATPYNVDLNSKVKFIYMPSVSINTATTGANRTLDLYNTYKTQFNTPQVASATAPAAIAFFPAATDLYYYVTYYDTNVFANVSIDVNGNLKYDVIGTATDCTYMNIVFVVK